MSNYIYLWALTSNYGKGIYYDISLQLPWHWDISGYILIYPCSYHGNGIYLEYVPIVPFDVRCQSGIYHFMALWPLLD